MVDPPEGPHTEEHGEKITEQCDNEGDDQVIKVEGAIFKKSSKVIQDELFPLKVNSKVEALHEKLTKRIIKEGYGNKPTQHSTCFVHYKTWTKSTMYKFEDIWQDQQPLELVLGKEKEVLHGMDISMISMPTSDHALFHVDGELGYGKEENFFFLNVPPMADLIYEVELIGFEESKEAKAHSDMIVEERIEAADKRW